MTIYTVSVITSTGYPFYNLQIKNLPKGIRLFLRFFDFTKKDKPLLEIDSAASFELNAGLISALFEFAKNMDKKIRTLEFKSRPDLSFKDEILKKDSYEGDVVITTQTETYLLHRSVREKVKLIYNSIITLKIPLDAGESISSAEEQKIIDILTDDRARNHFHRNQQEVRLLATSFLKEVGEYGLEAICITSFDLSPIAVFGDKYSFKDIEIMLRNIGDVPEIEPLEWKHRQSFFKDTQVWVYIINSGIGVTVDGLFEPYFYLLFASADSYLGEFPGKLTQEINMVLG